MKMRMMTGGCGAVVLTAAMLFAQDDKPKTINVVGLEDDKDNTTVVAPAELGSKPETVAISADALVKKAEESGAAAAEAKVNTANVKALTMEGMVIPPSSEMVKTLDEAIRNILVQAGKQVGTVSSNGIEKLVMPYQQLGDGKSYEVEWRKALRLLLTPVGYNFTEDGELVLFGLAEEVDVRHQQLAQERLASNRTPILFTTNESEGGMELRSAIRDVAVKADVTITTDYMEQSDLYVPVQTIAAEGKLTAEDIGKAKEKTVVQQSQVKRTTFDTNGQQVEWRIVLREILNPHDYDFVEAGGVVRIAKRAKIKQWEDEAVAKKPLTAKVIRLYHADPEAVVERVTKIKGLLKHPDASLQATRKKDDNTEVVKNLNARIQTSSGQQSGQSDTTSQVFDKLVRPRTIPAIIAYDVAENMDAIEEKIRLFDIKEKQILIEAIIFELDTNNGEGDMDGIQWKDFEQFIPLYGTFGKAAEVATIAGQKVISSAYSESESDGKFSWSGSRSITDTITESTEYDGSRRLENGFAVKRGRRAWMRSVGVVDFESVIQLIRRKSNAKLLSSPMIVVGDHSEAAIQVSRVTPVPQIEASSLSGMQSSDIVQNSLNVQWNMIRDGVLMWVSPEITETSDSVRLTLHPQVVDRGEKVDLSDLNNSKNKFNEYPVYNYILTMHEMDTRATVPSGTTLMFGGLIKNREEETEDKVRWLGDIPVIGWLFRSKTKQIVQQNLVIMIRPTILEDTDVTGFETNTLKEAESVMANSGRSLKKAPLEGPYSYKEVKKNIKDLYEERVVKPFKDEEGNGERGTGNGESSFAKATEDKQDGADKEMPAEKVSEDKSSSDKATEDKPTTKDGEPPEALLEALSESKTEDKKPEAQKADDKKVDDKKSDEK